MISASVSPSPECSAAARIFEDDRDLRRHAPLKASLIEQFQPLVDHVLHRFEHSRQHLVWSYFRRVFERRFQSAPPCDPQLRVDVNDRYACSDRSPEIVIIGARSAVQREKYACRTLDFTNALDVQPLFLLARDHAL